MVIRYPKEEEEKHSMKEKNPSCSHAGILLLKS